jgi:hypothetical protein
MAREHLSRLQRDILAWLVVEDQRLSLACRCGRCYDDRPSRLLEGVSGT